MGSSTVRKIVHLILNMFRFRPLVRIQPPTQTLVASRRSFNTSLTLLKKKGAGKGAKTAETSSKIAVEEQELDRLHDIDIEFNKVLTNFSDKAKHLKSGDADLSKWQNLKVDVHGAVAQLKNIANVQIKAGNRLIQIVSFDPKDVKHIQSAVISEFHITPQVDPKNKQALIVSLPSKDKSEVLKQIKALHDDFRNSHKIPTSLAIVRSNFMNKIKKAKKDLTEDEFKKFNTKIEKAYQDYSAKLQKAQTSAESGL